MNIDDYRAMVEQEKQSAQEQQQTDSKGEQPNAQAQQAPTDDTQARIQTQGETDTTSQDDSSQAGDEGNTSTEPEYIEVDGEQVALDELRNGYLRQSDYTRKTQELAKDREKAETAERYYEAVNSDPEQAKEFAERHNLPYSTPEEARVTELETAYHDLLLEKEISTLESKYPDFDAKEVIGIAYDKKLPDLEDAYLLYKAQVTTPADPIDTEALTEQIRQQIMDELQLKGGTDSVIGTGGGTAQISSTPTLSQGATRVAKAMGLTPEEYAKWSK